MQSLEKLNKKAGEKPSESTDDAQFKSKFINASAGKKIQTHLSIYNLRDYWE